MINKAKRILPAYSIKSLYYALVHSHMMHCIQAWGNSTAAQKIFLLQKRIIRILSMKDYRSHTEPLFKFHNILKFNDLYNLQVALFMFDLRNKYLPRSFENFIKLTHPVNRTVITRQHKNIFKERPRTKFSSKLPKHQFVNIWNSLNDNLKAAQYRSIFKASLKKQVFTRTQR